MQACKQQLDALLFDAHMTRANLARAFGVAPESISRWNTRGIPQYAVAYLKLKAENISLRKQLGADGGI